MKFNLGQIKKLKNYTSISFKINKSLLIFLSIAVVIILFIFPFFITTRKDSLLSIYSFSFTAISAIGSFGTLIIAISLYQRFGLESKFIEKQTFTVIELAECIKGRVITANCNNELTFLIRAKIIDIEEEKRYFPMNIEFYKKIVTFKSIEDFNESMKPILKFKYDYWLPDEIKQKMNFLNFYASISDKENNSFENVEIYSEFDFGTNNERNLVTTHPQLTVEQFLKGYSDLVASIYDWLENHCKIKIDLKLHESNIYKNE